MNCKKCNVILTKENWWVASQRQHRYLCIDCVKDYQKVQYKKHREQQIRRAALWNKNNPERHSKNQKKMQTKVKSDVFTHYSSTNPPQCANPYGEHEKPYTNLITLSLDLIKGGHGRRDDLASGGTSLYCQLRKDGYPEGWQVLCMNCQYIKRDRNKELRHKY
jgi:hypothetical protein